MMTAADVFLLCHMDFVLSSVCNVKVLKHSHLCVGGCVTGCRDLKHLLKITNIFFMVLKVILKVVSNICRINNEELKYLDTGSSL